MNLEGQAMHETTRHAVGQLMFWGVLCGLGSPLVFEYPVPAT